MSIVDCDAMEEETMCIIIGGKKHKSMNSKSQVAQGAENNGKIVIRNR